MNILCFNAMLAPAFTAAGHTVINLLLDDQTPSLPELLHEHKLRPDLIIQQENLGKRIVVRDLESAPCPTVFIAIDSHLNMFWHKHYAQLFDAVFTAHVSRFAALPAEFQPVCLGRLAHFGIRRPMIPFARRNQDIALCARLTEHRPLRQWLIELLQQRCGLIVREGLDHKAMFDFYADTRFVPNESICFEVNFRLLEAASCGAVVLSQDIGQDQDCLFDAGKEIFIYRDGLELLDQIAFLRKNSPAAEKMGQAARLRVQREHLAEHRVAAILNTVQGLPRNRARGNAAAYHYWMSCLQLTRNRALITPVPALLAMSEQLEQNDAVLAGQLRLLMESHRHSQAHALCMLMLQAQKGQDSLECNSTASACALLWDNVDLARTFLFRHQRSLHPHKAPPPPAGAVELCLHWADIHRKAGQLAQPGFSYAPGGNKLPACAYDFLLLADSLDKDNSGYLHKAAALTAELPEYTPYRLGYLARLSLEQQDNWRLQLEYGLCSLRCCRVAEGVHEIIQAARKAKEQGKEASFTRMLAAAPTHEYIERVLTV